MNCKDCIHYEVCIPDMSLIRMQIDENEIEKHCTDFKDKSKIIELPCKVGDAVYFILNEDNKKSIIPNIVTDISQKQIFFSVLENGDDFEDDICCRH